MFGQPSYNTQLHDSEILEEVPHLKTTHEMSLTPGPGEAMHAHDEVG